MERFRATDEPPKKKRGRPVGASNKATQLSVRQALLTGPSGHMQLREWGTTGVIMQPETEFYPVPKPLIKTDEKTGEKKIIPDGDWEIRERVKKDKDGRIEYVLKPLDIDQRIHSHDKANPYFASAVHSEKEGRTPQELELLLQLRGRDEIEWLSTPPMLLIGSSSSAKVREVQ